MVKIVQSNLYGHHSKRMTEEEAKKQGILTNHRKIEINEIVFDIDTHNKHISEELESYICSKLIKDRIRHSSWWTSRSIHIHAYFKLDCFPKEQRNKIRKELIKHYVHPHEDFLDLHKTENTMIRDFNSIHEITGKRKTLRYSFEGSLGIVPKHIVLALNSTINEKRYVPSLKQKSLELQRYATFIEHCLKTQFQEGNRNQVLFKNIAIAVHCLGLSKDQVKACFNQIIENCKGKKYQELQGWYNWCDSKDVQVNFRELRKAGFVVPNLS